ncbi:hypothetical protein F7725_016142, partial [Dissostichus mawsoni]
TLREVRWRWGSERIKGGAAQQYFTDSGSGSVRRMRKTLLAAASLAICQDCTDADKRVEIHVMNHPTKNKRLATASVTLTTTNKFQELVQIMIPTGDFSKDPSNKQYVYLQAQFPDRLLEKVVMTPEGIILPLDPVSLKSGIHSGDYQLAEIVRLVVYRVYVVFSTMNFHVANFAFGK